MATSQGFLLWLLINNLENNVNFQQNLWKRSLENYSTESCPSQVNHELNSFLWYMDGNPRVYFFGTIHVPYTKVWDYIPLNSKRAFRTVSSVYFELDVTDQENLRTLEQCKSLPHGVKLRDVLPKTLYKRIKTHLSYIRGKLPEWITFEQQLMGLNPLRLYQQMTKNWHKNRPIWIMLLLDKITEYYVKLIAPGLPVLDTYLIQEARLNHKKLGYIETVEEQCEVLNKLNNSKVILALNHTLILHEKIRRGEDNQQFSTKQLIYHYNCGNLKDVLSSQVTSGIANLENISETNSWQKQQIREFEEYMKEELLFKRNKKMAKRIVKIVNKEPRKSMIFAFGAGHFIGNRSVISILQNQGYNITHLKASDPLPRDGPNRVGKHCKKHKKKKKKGRKNNRKQKRKRYRYRKHCNEYIRRKKITTTKPKSKTTTCASCITTEPVVLKEKLPSSAAIDSGQQVCRTLLGLVLVFKMVGA